MKARCVKISVSPTKINISSFQVWNIFPKGMFIDNIVEVAKKELAWEVDYIREAECTRKFKKLLAPYPEYFVPDVIGNSFVLLSCL